MTFRIDNELRELAVNAQNNEALDLAHRVLIALPGSIVVGDVSSFRTVAQIHAGKLGVPLSLVKELYPDGYGLDTGGRAIDGDEYLYLTNVKIFSGATEITTPPYYLRLRLDTVLAWGQIGSSLPERNTSDAQPLRVQREQRIRDEILAGRSPFDVDGIDSEPHSQT